LDQTLNNRADPAYWFIIPPHFNFRNVNLLSTLITSRVYSKWPNFTNLMVRLSSEPRFWTQWGGVDDRIPPASAFILRTLYDVISFHILRFLYWCIDVKLGNRFGFQRLFDTYLGFSDCHRSDFRTRQLSYRLSEWSIAGFISRVSSVVCWVRIMKQHYYGLGLWIVQTQSGLWLPR
jgi:hypothetical protein